MGLPAPDPFGLNNLFSPAGSAKPAPGVAASVVPAGGGNPAGIAGGPALVDAEHCPPSRVPVGAFILIGLGVLFLLDEIGVLHYAQPVAFLAAGADCSRGSRPDAQNRKGLVRRTS